MIPDKVDLFLHVSDLGCGHYHCILLGNYYDVLAVGTVGSEGVVAAAPHLVAVTLEPVAGGRIDISFTHLNFIRTCRAARDLLRAHFLDPVGRNDLFACELASVQDAETHLGKVLGVEIEAPSACVDSGRTLQPLRFFNTERLPEAAFEVVDHFLAGDLLDSSRENVGSEAVLDGIRTIST